MHEGVTSLLHRHCHVPGVHTTCCCNLAHLGAAIVRAVVVGARRSAADFGRRCSWPVVRVELRRSRVGRIRPLLASSAAPVVRKNQSWWPRPKRLGARLAGEGTAVLLRALLGHGRRQQRHEQRLYGAEVFCCGELHRWRLHAQMHVSQERAASMRPVRGARCSWRKMQPCIVQHRRAAQACSTGMQQRQASARGGGIRTRPSTALAIPICLYAPSLWPSCWEAPSSAAMASALPQAPSKPSSPSACG
jgi:hypothetical protein